MILMATEMVKIITVEAKQMDDTVVYVNIKMLLKEIPNSIF